MLRLQIVSKKGRGHHRTGSAPPPTSPALLLSTTPASAPSGKRPSLQDIPEHQTLVSDVLPARTASVRFPDQSEDVKAIVSRVLESPSTSPNSTPRGLDSPTSTPRQGESVIEHQVSDDYVLNSMMVLPQPPPPPQPLPPPPAAAPSSAEPTRERVAVPRLSLPERSSQPTSTPTMPAPLPKPEIKTQNLPITSTQHRNSAPVGNSLAVEMPSTPPPLGAQQSPMQAELLRHQLAMNTLSEATAANTQLGLAQGEAQIILHLSTTYPELFIHLTVHYKGQLLTMAYAGHSNAPRWGRTQKNLHC